MGKEGIDKGRAEGVSRTSMCSVPSPQVVSEMTPPPQVVQTWCWAETVGRAPPAWITVSRAPGHVASSPVPSEGPYGAQSVILVYCWAERLGDVENLALMVGRRYPQSLS